MQASFKAFSEYRKKLLRYVPARISNDHSAYDIVEEVDILQVITWTAAAWKEVSGMIEDKDDQNALVSMKEKLEKIVITQKKQTNIRDYFV